VRSRPPVGSFRMLPVMFSLAPALVAIGRPTISMGAVPAIVMMGGKGFGGGEATRDPMPTAIDPNDPKGKQQAIHKAESFAEYLAKRNGASRSVAPPMMPAPLPGVTKDHEIYAWLKWSPPIGSPVYDTLHRCFPGAIPGSVVLDRTIDAVRPFGMDPENTLYGQSICPDEINNEKGDLSSLMIDHWGEVFPMGGIGGVPFVGKTGFSAFSHHVPTEGHLLILFGPHIAISSSGELGKYMREGQDDESTACGAVLAAYSACCADHAQAERSFLGKSYREMLDVDDMQQSFLKEKVGQRFDAINGASEPLDALIHEAYQVVEDQMLSVINFDYGDGKIVLVGGVQINMPQPHQDHFQPLYFKALSGDSPVGVDLMSNFRYSGN